MAFFKKRKSESVAERPMIAGSVRTNQTAWNVREEKRGGERSQLLILQSVDDPACEMHIRPLPGNQAASLADVEALAADPTYRFFTDASGRRWEAGIVVTDEPGQPPRQLIKFISRMDVHEVAYPFDDGLGLRADAQLRELLSAAIGQQ